MKWEFGGGEQDEDEIKQENSKTETDSHRDPRIGVIRWCSNAVGKEKAGNRKM